MKCMTCSADIPPSFVHAIQNNSCPGCGGVIMDDNSKRLLTELKEAMVKMPNDPEGLAGWLLSNYHLNKIGTGEPTNFYRKPNKPTKADLIKQKKLKIARNPIQDFLKRKNPSLAKSIESRKDFAEIAEQINNGEIEEEMYGDDEELEQEDLEQEELEAELDPEEEAEYNRHVFRSQAKQIAKNSLLLPGGQPLTPKDTEAMIEAVAGTSNQLDEDNLPAALQVSRMERLKKQRDIAEGGGKGNFRRGS